MKDMGSWDSVCSAQCPVKEAEGAIAPATEEYDSSSQGALLQAAAKNESCTDADSFCSLHVDTWCTSEAAQGNCVRSCCRVLAGPHYGHSYEAGKKRDMGSWDSVCSAQCPVKEAEGAVAPATEEYDSSSQGSLAESEKSDWLTYEERDAVFC